MKLKVIPSVACCERGDQDVQDVHWRGEQDLLPAVLRPNEQALVLPGVDPVVFNFTEWSFTLEVSLFEANTEWLQKV